MKTVLISSVTPSAGKTLVVNSVNTYWQRYYSGQSMGTMVIPTLTPDALSTGEEPNLAQLWRSLCQARKENDFVCLDSTGSLSSPVTRDTTLATLAKEWRLPVILVSPVRWDAIAPTVATISLAREAQVTLVGVLLNEFSPNLNISVETMADLLRSLTQVSTIGTLPFLENPDDEKALANIASSLRLDDLIEKLD